jgi:hypothetical protein
MPEPARQTMVQGEAGGGKGSRQLRWPETRHPIARPMCRRPGAVTSGRCSARRLMCPIASHGRDTCHPVASSTPFRLSKRAPMARGGSGMDGGVASRWLDESDVLISRRVRSARRAGRGARVAGAYDSPDCRSRRARHARPTWPF